MIYISKHVNIIGDYSWKKVQQYIFTGFIELLYSLINPWKVWERTHESDDERILKFICLNCKMTNTYLRIDWKKKLLNVTDKK